MKKKFAIIIIFFSVFSVKNNLIFANDNQEFVNLVFAELDMNKDGIIDKNDLQKFSKKEFDLMDKNKDALISKEEFFNYVCDKSCAKGDCECNDYQNKENIDYLREYWQKIDKNNDDNITQSEKLESDLETFYLLDSDNDGKLKKEDIEAQLY